MNDEGPQRMNLAGHSVGSHGARTPHHRCEQLMPENELFHPQREENQNLVDVRLSQHTGHDNSVKHVVGLRPSD